MRTLVLLVCFALALAVRPIDTSIRANKPIPVHIPVQTVNSTDTFEVPYWLGAFYATVDVDADWFLPVTVGNGGATYPGEFLYIRNYGPQDITLYTTNPETIEGAASYVVAAGTVLEILSGYPNWVVVTPFNVGNVTCGAGMSCVDTQVSLAPVGTAETTDYPTSITVNAYGQITSKTAGTQPLTTVAGTTNQLAFSCGTGACTGSLPSTIVTPGSLQATTFLKAPAYTLDSTGSTTTSPATILAGPMTGTQAFRIGGLDGSGIQASIGSRTALYSKESMRFFGGRDTATPPTFESASATDASHWFTGTTPTRPVIRIAPATGQTASIMEIRTNGSSTSIVDVIDSAGHFGLAQKTNPTNAWIYIGTGTGTLLDTPIMGMKVKLDTAPGTAPTGIQSNINIPPGTGSINLRGSICSRLDISDPASSGVGVSMWSDVFVAAPSRMNTWGANIYSQIGAPTSPGTLNYTGVSVGAEIGIFNFGVNEQIGGGLSMVMGGTTQVKFGILLKSGGYPDANFGLNSTQNAQHFILASDDTVTDAFISGRGPAVNFIYYGPLRASNAPTGTPKFKVAANGETTAVHYFSSTATPTVSFGAASCTTASTSITGSDHSMVISFTVSATCVSVGAVFTVTFAIPFGTIPKNVLCGSANALTRTSFSALGAGVDTSDISTTGFTFSIGSAFASTGAYSIGCQVGIV